MSLACNPSWPLVLVISLVGCGDDPALRLARSFEALCEHPVACSETDEAFFEDCLDFLWTAAAPLEHVYGEGCVDALASQVECLLAYDCGCSSDDRIWCCDLDNSCTSRPCEEEAVPAGDACGGFYFPLGIGYGGGAALRAAVAVSCTVCIDRWSCIGPELVSGGGLQWSSGLLHGRDLCQVPVDTSSLPLTPEGIIRGIRTTTDRGQ